MPVKCEFCDKVHKSLCRRDVVIIGDHFVQLGQDMFLAEEDAAKEFFI